MLSDVQKFYFGKNVFVTGATGFLGKLLVEKLLRCCPGIGNIYVMIRRKKGKDINIRINEVLADPIFNRLLEEVPEYRGKIIVIEGDCTKPHLGLSPVDREVLMKVNVVFHLAETVKFNEHLQIALETNVRAASDLLKLSQEMLNLDVFMHVSTAFSTAPLPIIKENTCCLETNSKELQKLIINKTDDQIREILPSILGPWPNTYTFTKALAEVEIQKKAGNKPVGIFRPAIVLSTLNEPIEGWIENLYGPTGVVIATGMGIMHTLHSDGNVIANIVPADYAVNCLIVASLDVYKSHKESSLTYRPYIYNYVSSVENPITWERFTGLCLTTFDKYPFLSAVWYKSMMLNKHPMINFFFAILCHIIPGIFMDMFSLLTLKKPRMIKLYQKIQKCNAVHIYFLNRNVLFCNKRTRKLWDDCSSLDKQLFPFSVAEINWTEYVERYILGIRRHLLKEKDENLPEARRKLRRLFYLHTGLKLCIFILFSSIVYIAWSRYLFSINI